MITNFEFKASCKDILACEKKLALLNPEFIGEDHQKDTYFNVPAGRLKLREGNIENALIYYERMDIPGAKQSNIILYQTSASTELKKILIKMHGIKKVIDKRRRIYLIDNVKFHFDKVENLGCFLEVEAIDIDGTRGIETLKQQCNAYAKILNIAQSDYLSLSYADMAEVTS